MKHREKGTLPDELNISELKGYKLIDKETHKRWKSPFIGELKFRNLIALPDDVLTNKKKLLVIDIKTIGKKPVNCTRESMLKSIEKYSYKLQLEFYNYVLRKIGYKTEDFGYILFYYFDDLDENKKSKLQFERFKIDLSVGNVEQLLEKAGKILEKNIPPKERCEFCSSHKERYEDEITKQKKQQEVIDEILKEMDDKKNLMER